MLCFFFFFHFLLSVFSFQPIDLNQGHVSDSPRRLVKLYVPRASPARRLGGVVLGRVCFEIPGSAVPTAHVDAILFHDVSYYGD